MIRPQIVPPPSCLPVEASQLKWTRTFAALLVVLLVSALFGCKQQARSTTQLLAGRTMGTTYSVTIVPVGKLTLQELNSQIEAELKSVNQQMSNYLPDSELSQFNASHVENWFPVSLETASIVALSKEVSESTGGAFDVTVGPLVSLWGFGPDGQPERIPDEEAIQAVKNSVGAHLVDVRFDPPALRKLEPDLEIDLSAIAKGHGVDRLASLLEELGVEAYFVEIGGEVRARGTRPDGSPWRVGIERPLESERDLLGVLQLSTGCLATSGNYRNFYIRLGKRYAHTIDPRSGMPVETDLLSASVVADDCATADALATSMMCLGWEEGLRLADANQWAVLLVVDEDGQTVLKRSQVFAELFPDFQALDLGSSSSSEGVLTREES